MHYAVVYFEKDILIVLWLLLFIQHMHLRKLTDHHWATSWPAKAHPWPQRRCNKTQYLGDGTGSLPGSLSKKKKREKIIKGRKDDVRKHKAGNV